MCGITGFMDASKSFDSINAPFVLSNMADKIKSRGPDAFGYWFSKDRDIAFGHRRLSVIDLSSSGSQPMISDDGRYVIIFNGEIYNHQSIRENILKAHPNTRWSSSSDTQTLLVAIKLYGIKNAVQRCKGMFSFAIWDNKDNILHLCRDRFGEKPLYYGWQESQGRRVFLFGSQLSSLRQHPFFQSKISKDALSLYMEFGNIPGKLSIYEGINKLSPGSILTLHKATGIHEIENYWSAEEKILKNHANKFQGSRKEGINQLESLLKSTIKDQMVSDVPIGAFLSGGIDSSLIVSLMQDISNKPVKTFSIGFEDKAYNEADDAKNTANILGTEHHDLYLTAEDVLNQVPYIPYIYDEPFADQSQIPTYLVSKMAREKVTVSLSGDAGDELFGGYTRHQAAATSFIFRSPYVVKKLLGKSLKSLSPSTWDSIFNMSPLSNKWQDVGSKIHKFSDVLGSRDRLELYYSLISNHRDINNIFLDKNINKPSFLDGHSGNLATLSDIEFVMALDVIAYLPDDILTKVDRAAMSVSLETRVPFLDHELAEFAWSLPIEYKTRDESNNFVSKWILKELLSNYVPKEFFNRPKMGFGMPVADWLKGPLKEWAEEIIYDERVKKEKLFNLNYIKLIWKEHQRGTANHQKLLWNFLMFQYWSNAQ